MVPSPRATRAARAFSPCLSVTGMSEEVGALFWGEVLNDAAGCIPERVTAARFGASQLCFDLGEALLDRIEVWRVCREEPQAGMAGFDCLPDTGDLVAGEIVGDDNVTRRQRGGEELLDIGNEGIAIDRAIEHQRSDYAVMPQAGDEGAGLPVSIRYRTHQSLAARRSAACARHVGLGPCFIDEDQACDVE